MSAPLECRLMFSSSSFMLEQVIAGFAMLGRDGRLRLSAARAPNYVAGVLAPPKLEARLNGRLALVYDVRDDAGYFEEALAGCDFYFKRSYDPGAAAAHPHGHKLAPLGLFYGVYSEGDFWRRRALWSLLTCRPGDARWVAAQIVRSSALLSRLFAANNGRYACALANFEGTPKADPVSGVLLLTQTWDPAEVHDNPAKAEQREAINEMRAGCIRKLRQEHGPHFLGGFSPSAYARRYFPDCVVADPRQTRKLAFIRAIRQASICVTTMGLHRANGARLGEYVAGARAIVTERLNFAVPGHFEAGANYLDFTTPDECVAATVALRDDPARRQAMMARNQEYYRAYLRPDVLIWNTLQAALAGAAN